MRLRVRSGITKVAIISALVASTLNLTNGHQAGATAIAGLHVQGNTLLDGSNRPLILHGVNRSGTEYACVKGPSFADGPTDTASVQAMLAWHLNAVRVPLNEDCWLGINGVAVGGATYQQNIITWVNTLAQSGMVAILDLHWSAPGTLKAVGQQPMADADHAPAFWTSVAGTFKGNGSVIFDLYNEPDPIPYKSSYPGGFGAWQSADFSCVRNGCRATATQGNGFQVVGMQQLVNTVRATGATNLIMVGGIQAAQTVVQYMGNRNVSGSYLPVDPLGNMAVATHMYAQDACGDIRCWNSGIAPVSSSYPVIVGEFGDTNCSATLTNALLPWLDGRNISYLGWNWGTTFGCQSLIDNYNGAPTVPYGAAYQSHLATLAGQGAVSTATATSTPVPPTTTSTPAPPPATGTATSVAASPTATSTPATPPSSTSTPPSTATSLPATATATYTPRPTSTSVPPTATPARRSRR